MKNLYIYILDCKGKIKKEIWQDVCVTKKGEIVTYKNKHYRLDHGKYELKKDLCAYIKCLGISISTCPTIQEVKYISLQDDCDIEQLKKPFIDEIEKEIECLQSKLELFKSLVEVSISSI
jgi:hypothetical protein